MITSAYISHFKSISEANLRFSNVNVIVGPNGSGKSNILDAVCFLHDCASDDIDTAVTKRHGIDSLRQWSRTRPYNITLSVCFKNASGNGSYRVVIASNKGNYRILEEEGEWFGESPLNQAKDVKIPQLASFRRDESGLISISQPFPNLQVAAQPSMPQDELFLTSLANRAVPVACYLVFQHITRELTSFSKYNIYPNTLRNPQIVSKEAVLREDGSNLASVLKRINSTRRLSGLKEDLLSGLKSMMPSVIDFQVKSAAGFYVPVLRVKEANDDVHDFNLSQISDGTLRTLGLLAAFYQPSGPDKIGVEEPEQMIHPGALPVIYEAMLSFSRDKKRQVFMTTHSPTLLDQFDPQSVIWTKIRKGLTESGPIKERQLGIIKEHLFTTGELLLAEGFF